MPDLSINELLDSVGINQSILAKLMQVSRSTITRMKDIASPEVIAAIDKYKHDMTSEQSESVPVPDSPVYGSMDGLVVIGERTIEFSGPSDSPIRPKLYDDEDDLKYSTPEDVDAVLSDQWSITHRNIALSRIKYGREGWTIDKVASLFGLSIFAYNAEVQNTINHCVESGTSFKELRE